MEVAKHLRDLATAGIDIDRVKDLVVELEFSAEQIQQEPDRCGYRLVERVYEAFSYRREQIPEEFDQKTGRLILPE